MPRPIPKSSRKRLLRLVSARADVDYAKESYQLFQATDSEPARYHLFLSMVVCYCRPFTESSGIGSLRCEYPDYPDFADPLMNVRHQRMLYIRHKFLGHSSIDGSQVLLLAPGSQHPASGENVTTYHYAIAKRQFARPEYAGWLFELVSALATRLDADLRAVCHELGSRYVARGTTYEIDTGRDDFSWTVPNDLTLVKRQTFVSRQFFTGYARLGVVISVVWLLGFPGLYFLGLHTFPRSFADALWPLYTWVPGGSIEIAPHSYFTQTYPSLNWRMLILFWLSPVVIPWFFLFLIPATIRWVKAGFPSEAD